MHTLGSEKQHQDAESRFTRGILLNAAPSAKPKKRHQHDVTRPETRAQATGPRAGTGGHQGAKGTPRARTEGPPEDQGRKHT